MRRPARVVLPWVQRVFERVMGGIWTESLPDPQGRLRDPPAARRGGRVGLLGIRLPGGFVPEEDQGYFYVNAQLPLAASLERTAASWTSSTPSSRTRRASSTTRAWAASAC